MKAARETLPPRWVRAERRRRVARVVWHVLGLGAWLAFLWGCQQTLWRIQP